MEVVEVEGEDISPEDFHNDAGWLSCHKQRRQSTYSTLSSTTRMAGTVCFGATRTPVSSQSPRSPIPARYRQPRLPKEDIKIVLRPRDGLDVRKHSEAHLRDAINSATALQPSEVEMDILRTNPTQNIVIISTPKIENAEKYNALREICISDKTYEIRAYATAPEDTAKGVIHNIPAYDSDEDINKSLKYRKNPTILTARRMGKTNSAIIIFEGSQVPYFVYYRGAEYRCFLHKKKQEICDACGGVGHRKDVCPQPENKTCKTCGASNPDSAHGCIPQCAICGKDHVTGDKRCRQRYKTPYLLIQRKWEKIKQQRLNYQHAGSEALGRDSREEMQQTRTTAHLSRKDLLDKAHNQERGRSKSFPRLPRQTLGAQNSRRSSRSASKNVSGSTRGRSKSQARAVSTGHHLKEEDQRNDNKVSWAAAVSQDQHQTHSAPDPNSQLEQELQRIRELLETTVRENVALKQEITALKAQINTGQVADNQVPPIENEPIEADGAEIDSEADSPPPKRKASEILNRPRIQEEIKRQLSVNLDKRFDSITEKIESKIADFAASIQKQMGIMNTRITKLENTLAVQCNDPRLSGNARIVGEHN